MSIGVDRVVDAVGLHSQCPNVVRPPRDAPAGRAVRAGAIAETVTSTIDAYATFDRRESGWTKVVFEPGT